MYQQIQNNLNLLNNKNFSLEKLTNENTRLFNQIIYIQKKLEEYYNNISDNKKNLNIENNNLYQDNLKDLLKQIIRLNAINKQLKVVLQIEKQNTLAIKLGKILIKGVSSYKEFIKLPFRLYKIWTSLIIKKTPKFLGGEKFQNVIDTYTRGGMEELNKLLDSRYISSVMRANAYTALARYLKSSNKKQVANFAKLAWETDPQPYRLKWLAFRLHECGDSITAEAILDLLPQDISMTQSEINHTIKIRQDSNIEINKQVQIIIENRYNKIITSNKTIEIYKNSIELQKKEYDSIVYKLNKKCEDYNLKISSMNIKSIELQNIININKNEIEQLRNDKEYLQQKVKIIKNNSDALALHTAIMLKNLLTQYEPHAEELTKIMRIIMGDIIKKQ